MSKLRALLTIGTRPEAIKMAPLARQCRGRPDEIETLVCLTGQHREMLTQVTDYFELATDANLEVMQTGQTLAGLTAACLTGLDGLMDRYQPDCIVAQGDTTTVMAASLAAFYRRIPFVHVEAGLRTGNLQSPWPEEMNRRVASLATTLHCAPTQRARQNLLAEGVPAERVRVTGNTVIDALNWTLDRERRADSPWPSRYAFLADRRMVLITGHRRENFGAGMAEICLAISELADLFPEVEFVYPVHLNPQVQEPVHAALAGRANVRLAPPAGYAEFVWLMDRSTVILTDSGGVQEEAPTLGRPVLVMRETTERPEAVECGAAELVGASAERIVAACRRLLEDPAWHRSRQVTINPYGDGQAAERIVDWMLESFAEGRDL